MKPPGLSAALVLWLGLVCVIALFHGLFALAPVDKTEALQIGIAETMLRLGDWTVPQWNGHLYADKPPLPYWLEMGLWGRLGLHPEWARLPAAICATGGVVAVAWVLRIQAKADVSLRSASLRATLAGTLLALSPGWISFGHTAVHDIYLAVAISLALLGYAIGFNDQASAGRIRLVSLWIGLWCGIGFLSKGLLGIGLPLVIMAVDALPRPTTRRQVLRPQPLLLFGVALLTVIGPWLAALIHAGRWDYLQGFLGFSNLERATRAVDGHDQPLIFYLPVLLALLWPWWPLLLSSLQQLWQRRRGWGQAQGLERLLQLAAIWLLASLLLFTLIPTKLPGYILPVLPPASLLMAGAPRHPNWSLRLVAAQLIVLNLAMIGLLLVIPLGGQGPYLHELLANPGVTAGLGVLSGLALLCAGWAWRGKGQGRRLAALALSMLFVVASLPTLARPYRTLYQDPLLKLAHTAEHEKSSAHVLYVLGKPLYSVVPLANLPTIFGSPLKTAALRPTSSYQNWQSHGHDPEALVLGPCRQINQLKQAPAVAVRLVEQQGNTCLAHWQRQNTPDNR